MALIHARRYHCNMALQQMHSSNLSFRTAILWTHLLHRVWWEQLKNMAMTTRVKKIIPDLEGPWNNETAETQHKQTGQQEKCTHLRKAGNDDKSSFGWQRHSYTLQWPLATMATAMWPLNASIPWRFCSELPFCEHPFPTVFDGSSWKTWRWLHG